MSGYYPDGVTQATFDRHWSNQLDLPEDEREERDEDDDIDDEVIEPALEEEARERDAEARESD